MDTVLLRDNRVLHVLAEVFEEGLLSTGELRHLLYYDEDDLFFLFLNRCFNRRSDNDLLLRLLGVHLDRLGLNVILDHVQHLDLLYSRGWGRRRRLLAGLLNLYFFLKEELCVGHLILRDLSLSPLQRHVNKAQYEYQTHQCIDEFVLL